MIRNCTRTIARVAIASALLAAFGTGCGGGTTNPPPMPPPPPNGDAPTINRFESNAMRVAPMGHVTLTWEVAKATQISITANPGGALVTNSNMLSGMIESMPIAANTVFTLTAVGAGGMASREVSITVDANAASISSFTANPPVVAPMRSTDLQWRTVGADQVRITAGGMTIFTSSIAAEVASGTFTADVMAPSTTFTLTAANARGGMSSQDVTVRVVEPVRIRQFRARPQLFQGATAMISLNWVVENSTMIALTANGMPVANAPNMGTATVSVSVTGATRFELTARNDLGAFVDSRLVAQAGTMDMEPNDTSSAAQPLTGGATGRISPEGDVDYYSITVPNGGNVTIEVSDGNGGCNFDSIVQLRDSMDNLVVADDDGGAPLTSTSACSLIDPRTNHPEASDLAAGTYYIAVRAYQSPNPAHRVGQYALIVSIEPGRCGNTMVETRLMEQCDDGNTAAGDGCAMDCRFEFAGTHMGPSMMPQSFTQMLGAGELDVYQVVMASEGYIRAETFAPTAPTCNADTVLILADSMSQVLGSDDNDGTDNCSLINPTVDTFAHVMAGTYFLAVRGNSATAVVGNYTLVIRTFGLGCGNSVPEMGEQCDDGNTVGGDGCSATCTFEPRGTHMGPGNMPETFMGTLGMAQQHAYNIVMAQPGFLFAETFIPSSPTCTSPMMGGYTDTELVLYDSSGMQVGSNDDGGVGLCSQIDPRVDMFATLAAGTYTLVVRPLNAMRELGNYTLVVRTPAPGCGNGIPEMNEQCDDNNTTPGDGCNATCQLEIAQTFNPPGGNATFTLGQQGSVRAFRVNIATAGQSLTATVADPASADCPPVEISLRDPAGMVLGTRGAAFGSCAALFFPLDSFAANLAAGMYTLVVTAVGTSTAPSRLDLRVINPRCGNGFLETRANEQCDDNNTANGDGCSSACRFEGNVISEVEPNDVAMMATPSTAVRGTRRTLAGSISPATDLDFWAFDVPAGMTATLSAVSFPSPADRMTCTQDNDNILTLLDSAGTELAQNDDSTPGMNYCGALTVASEGMAVQNLAAGRYYVRIESYMGGAVLSQYFIDIDLQ